ncbi:hypothetical protein Tco_0066043 [Tanacetum coccineum]
MSLIGQDTKRNDTRGCKETHKEGIFALKPLVKKHKNDGPQIPGTRLEPQSDKESPEVEITNDEEVEVTKVKKQVPEQAKISLQIQKAIDHHIPSQVDASVRSYMSGHILHVHPAQTQTLSVPEQQYQLYLSMKDNPQLQQQDIAIWLALQMKFENLRVQQNICRAFTVRP